MSQEFTSPSAEDFEMLELARLSGGVLLTTCHKIAVQIPVRLSAQQNIDLQYSKAQE